MNGRAIERSRSNDPESRYWTRVLPDPEGEASWRRYREQIHSAIVRSRLGGEAPAPLLGAHWYVELEVRS